MVVDIGCGMAAMRTSLKAYQLPDSLAGVRSAIEAGMRIRYRIEVVEGARPIQEPQFETDDYYAVTAFGTTLDEATRKAVEYMIDYLVAEHGYKEIQMSNSGGIRSFSGPYESWREDTVWPRGIWRLENDPLVVYAKSKKGIFHIYLQTPPGS